MAVLEKYNAKAEYNPKHPPTSAQEEIIKKLSAIKKQLFALSAPLLKAHLYADQAC
jgi:hypothetical protein